MNQLIENFAKALYELNISRESIQKARKHLEMDELYRALSNPVIRKKEKLAVIDTVFSNEIKNFLKVLCDYDSFPVIFQILQAYEDLLLRNNNGIKAVVCYVSRPNEEELIKIKEAVCIKHKKTVVVLELREDPSLIGGFTLQVGDILYDKSIRGALDQLYNTLAVDLYAAKAVDGG